MTRTTCDEGVLGNMACNLGSFVAKCWVMRAIIPACTLAVAILVGSLFEASAVLARADGDTYCSLPQTFGAALRYLRVDFGFEVTEKDPEAAYLLFKYRVPGDPKREVAGAIELVKIDKKVRISSNSTNAPITRTVIARRITEKVGARIRGSCSTGARKAKRNNPGRGFRYQLVSSAKLQSLGNYYARQARRAAPIEGRAG